MKKIDFGVRRHIGHIKYVVDQYKYSINNKEKGINIILIAWILLKGFMFSILVLLISLNSRKIDYLIGDGNVYTNQMISLS